MKTANQVARLGGACLCLSATLACAQDASRKEGWWAEVRGEESPAAEAAVEAPAGGTELTQPSGALLPEGAARRAAFECVEVRRFEIGAGDGFITSKETARAATIPQARLDDLQRAVAGQVPEKARGLRATLVGPSWPACPDPERALVLGGRVVDYKAGNQALRYFVGFGAGAQKFAVEVWLARKSDGALVARDEVVDRKVGGWLGGQSEKGVEDFAEKVGGFVRDSLR